MVVFVLLVLGRGHLAGLAARPGDLLRPGAAKDAFPDVLNGFWINVRLFLLAEPLSWSWASPWPRPG